MEGGGGGLGDSHSLGAGALGSKLGEPTWPPGPVLFLRGYRGSVLGSWQTSRTQDSRVSFLGWLAELPWTADNALLAPSFLPLSGWNHLDPPKSQPKEKEHGWFFSHVSPTNAGAISRARLRERGETSDPGCRSFSFPAVRSLRQAARNVPFSSFDPLSQNTSREGPGTGRAVCSESRTEWGCEGESLLPR